MEYLNEDDHLILFGEKKDKKLKNTTCISNGVCPRCFENIEVRRHKLITEKMLRQSYYFTQWDYCTNCGYIQLYEKYKVKNK